MPDAGFINLKDLLEIQNTSDPIFSTLDSSANDIKEQMKTQIGEQTGGAAFDLRLGSEYYLSGDNFTKQLGEGETVTIEPGQFALLTTYEIFHMPISLLAFISMRFSFKAEGLINVSGFQVDPGYQGIFIFAVYNAGPLKVPLKFKDKIFTVIFAKVEPIITNKRKPILKIERKKYINLMQNKNISQIALDERVSKLESWRSFMSYIVPTIIGGIAAAAVIAELVINAYNRGSIHP